MPFKAISQKLICLGNEFFLMHIMLDLFLNFFSDPSKTYKEKIESWKKIFSLYFVIEPGIELEKKFKKFQLLSVSGIWRWKKNYSKEQLNEATNLTFSWNSEKNILNSNESSLLFQGRFNILWKTRVNKYFKMNLADREKRSRVNFSTQQTSKKASSLSDWIVINSMDKKFNLKFSSFVSSLAKVQKKTGVSRPWSSEYWIVIALCMWIFHFTLYSHQPLRPLIFVCISPYNCTE